jgi:hypothetical protein
MTNESHITPAVTGLYHYHRGIWWNFWVPHKPAPRSPRPAHGTCGERKAGFRARPPGGAPPGTASPSRPSGTQGFRRGGRRRECSFPRLGFPPLDTPFPRRPLLGGIPPRGKTHPGGKSTAFFCLRVGRPWPERIPNSAGYGRPGTRSVPRVAAATPPLSQAPQSPRGIRTHKPAFTRGRAQPPS